MEKCYPVFVNKHAMHEFSLAHNILEIVEENVAKHKASKVTELTLDIGSLAGVELLALQTAIEAIKNKTVLEAAQVNFNIITATAVCLSCNKSFEPIEIFTTCPNCQSNNIQIITGKELIVRSIIAE